MCSPVTSDLSPTSTAMRSRLTAPNDSRAFSMSFAVASALALVATRCRDESPRPSTPRWCASSCHPQVFRSVERSTHTPARRSRDAARGELRCVAGTRSVLESGESVTKEAETPAFDRRRMDANAACDLIRGVLALARQDDPCPSCSSLLGRCGAHPALELGTYAIGDRDGNRRSPSTSHAATRSPR